MNIAGKIWGNTSEIFNKNNVEIHRINIVKGGTCSKHLHKHKYNLFFIERGSLLINVWKNDYDLIDKTIIKDNESCIVAPGEYHQFSALEDTICYEIYWVEISHDIYRESVGSLT